MAANTLSLDFGRDKRFYVYVYRDSRLRNLGAPIYVGKGTAWRRRADQHWKRRAQNPILAAILDKIRAEGLAPMIEVVAWFVDESDAFNLERGLIAKFGRRNTKTGTLANLTDGGDGTTGCAPSTKARAASRERLKKIRAAQWKDPSFRRKAIDNLDAGRALIQSDPNLLAKRSASIKRAKATLAADPSRSAEQSEQRRALRREAWKDPDSRAAYTAAIRAAKDAKSAKMKALWDDPEYRAKHGAKVSAATKAAWADPETRQRRTDAIRASRRRTTAAEADVSG